LTAQVNQDGTSQRFASAPTPLEVGQSDLENIQIQVLPVGDLKGQVIFEDEESRKPPDTGQRRGTPPARRVFLRGGSFQSTPNAEIAEDGTFTLKEVAAGVYHASISAGPIYVKSMTVGPSNFGGSKLDLTTGVPDAPLVLHVASSTGGIGGTVRDDKGPVP